jgi:hypothetical protein
MMFLPRHPDATLEHMGFIPSFLDDADPRLPADRFSMLDGDCLKFPGDPLLAPICELRMRDERIVLYPASVVAIIQPDGSFEVSRLD